MAAINRWMKNPSDVATRIELKDLESSGLLRSKSFTIDQGCVGLLFEGGTVEVLQPGEHTLDSLLRTFNRWGRRQGALLIVDGADHILNLPPVGGSSLDGGAIFVEAGLALTINDPMAFSQHVMGGCETLSREGLAQLMLPSVERAVKIGAPRQDCHSWATKTAGRDDLASIIERNILADFQRRGLTLNRVDILGLRVPDVENHQQRVRELRGREATAELDVLEANIKVDSEESMLAVQLRRTRLLAQQRDILHDDTLDDATKSAKLRESLADLEQAGAISAEQRQQVLLDLEAEGAQAGAKRQHAYALLSERHREELEVTRGEIDHRLRMASLEYERNQALAAGDTRIAILEQQLIEEDKAQALAVQHNEVRRAEALKDLNLDKATARTEIEIQAERDIAQADHLKRLQEIEVNMMAQEQAIKDQEASRNRDGTQMAHQHQLELARLEKEREIELARINKGDITQIEIARAQAQAAAAASQAQVAQEQQRDRKADSSEATQQAQSINQQMMNMVQSAMQMMGGVATAQAYAGHGQQQQPAAYPPPAGYPGAYPAPPAGYPPQVPAGYQQPPYPGYPPPPAYPQQPGYPPPPPGYAQQPPPAQPPLPPNPNDQQAPPNPPQTPPDGEQKA